MANYFCSDLHGEYDAFFRLLDKISFSDDDNVYILGDIIDKGADSSRLVLALSDMKNVFAILGNHEYYFLKHYALCVDDYSSGSIDDLWLKVGEYFQDDPRPFPPRAADYIENLPYYIEEKDFICVHAGVMLDSSGKILPMESQSPNHMIFDRTFKDDGVLPEKSKTVLFGHTPCSYQNETGKIIKTLRKGLSSAEKLSDYAKIRLDTGVHLTGLLGCIRKEDLAEFYVHKR